MSENKKQTLSKFSSEDNPFLELIETLEKNRPKFRERTKQALDWYRQKVEALSEGERDPMLVYETKRKTTFRFTGQLVTFKYDPKLKTEIPYYDKYPLTMVVKLYNDGFLGINFHYLKPIDRAIFMNSLYKYQAKKEFQTIINVTYSKLLATESLRYYKPCIKRYKYRNMSPKIAIIEPQLWDIALFLPTEKFQTRRIGSFSSKRKIWEESKNTIKRKK